MLALSAALALAGCADLQSGPKTGAGSFVGAGLGGLAGSQIGGGTGKLVATGAGVLLGALAGNQVGQSLDRADRLTAANATQRTLATAPTGAATTWRNPDSGVYGSVTPLRTTETAQNNVCREFQQTITVGGETRQGYGTACRQPDGSWRIVR
jgi:surface antigen